MQSVQSPEQIFKYRINELNDMKSQLEDENDFLSKYDAPQLLTDISTSALHYKHRKQQKELDIKIGESFILECRVIKGPITWFKNGVPIKTDTWVTDDSGGFSGQLKTFQVSSSTPEDTGDYMAKSCTMAGQCQTSVITITVKQ